MVSQVSHAHHVKALPPAIRVMEGSGFTAEQCLEGTGISVHELQLPDSITDFTLEQEFRFHRNLLQLTSDPLLGLRIGRAYTLENYGLFGYAFLSAPTLRQALMIVRNYGPLSFTLFKTDFKVRGRLAALQFSYQGGIPEDLLTYYVDRDLVASLFGSEFALPEPLALHSVAVMHSDQGNRGAYEAVFNCPLEFDAPCSELRIDAGTLDTPLPMSDVETSGLLQQQCKLLLARMSAGSGFVDRVRQIIVGRPGYFPDIDYVAEKLGMTSRNLRRKLDAEGSSFKQILAEVRHQLAKEYLATSSLPLEEISVLLGYSTPGNFSHAFKRWQGSSPRQFRQENR